MSTAPPPPRPQRAESQSVPFAVVMAALATALIVAAALLAGSESGREISAIVLFIPSIFLFGALARRKPATVVLLLVVVIGFSGTFAIHFGLPITATAWLLMLGLIASTLSSHFLTVRSKRLQFWPGLAVMVLYALAVAVSIPFAETLGIGGRGFIAGPAFVLVLLALAYAPWDEETRWRVLNAVIAALLVVGSYALFRLIVGPSSLEEKQATLSADIAGELALFGSFTSRLELGNFAAIAVPVLFAAFLGTAGRTRKASAIGFGLMVVALLGSQVRTALVAAVVGICVVLVLFQLASAFTGARAGITVIAMTGMLFIGGVGYAVTIADSPARVQRFEQILDPGEDYSFQRRVRKWNDAIAEINQHPFGQGLGTAGAVQRFRSRIFRLDNLYIDNSYLQVGIQLGYPGLILFVLGPVLVLFALAKNSLFTRNRRAAVLGIGASGAIVAWFIDLMTGDAFGSWAALLLSITIGLAVGAFVSEPPIGTGKRSRALGPLRAETPVDPGSAADQPARASTAA